ncbi:hypothetical protein BD626DRAFT_507445 [Schizophyllum amplum]|uniref:Uncharacterized protein n=1 Tax=Schizophyllum amplum TaxID=97359 RepID=A0A550C3Z7_9AGAR|nr:hypothetical protein BD626DRAFT_507445 [Auriculariopsis ampla]
MSQALSRPIGAWLPWIAIPMARLPATGQLWFSAPSTHQQRSGSEMNTLPGLSSRAVRRAVAVKHDGPWPSSPLHRNYCL